MYGLWIIAFHFGKVEVLYLSSFAFRIYFTDNVKLEVHSYASGFLSRGDRLVLSVLRLYPEHLQVSNLFF